MCVCVCVCVCVCYDDLGDEAIGSTNPEPTKTTEEHTESKKAGPVNEENPLRQGKKRLLVIPLLRFVS